MTYAIQTWLDLSVPLLFLILTLVYAGTALTTAWLAHRSPLRGWTQSFGGVVAPFFTAVSILFALQLGFLGHDVAERNRQAAQSVENEAHALRAAKELSIAAASDLAGIRAAMRGYLQSMLRDEWPTMASNGAADQTEQAFAAMMREVADPRVGREAGQAPHSALLAAIGQARQARSYRLVLAADRTNAMKWTAVLLLCLITQIAIATVHLDKPRAMAASLTIFTAAAIVAIGLVAVQETPFDGPMRVEPTALQGVLAALPAPAS